MGKKSVIAGLALAGLTIATTVAWQSAHPTPRFGGRLVTDWVNDLASDQFAVRDNAAEALRELGPRAVPHLAGALQRREHWTARLAARAASWLPFISARPINTRQLRSQAAEQLGAIGAKETSAVLALVHALAEHEPDVLGDVERALRCVGPACVPQLTRALSQRQPRVRERAAAVLEDFGPAARPAVPALLVALGDSQAAVRARAVQALGACGGRHRPVAGALERRLQDASPTVRSAAAEALGGLHAMESVPALQTALGDPDALVRIAAARSMWVLTRNATPLVPVLTGALRDQAAGWQAAYLLGDLGPLAAPAVPLLMVVLKQEKVPRPLRTPPASTIALGKIGAAAVPALTEALGHTEARVRTSAAIALGFVGHAAHPAVPALERLLDDAHLEVRQAAALSLGDIDLHSKALPPVLAAMTRDEDIFVSAAAASMLRLIDPQAGAPTENR